MATTVKNTITKLEYCLNIHKLRNTPTTAYIKPKKSIVQGLFSALAGDMKDSKTIIVNYKVALKRFRKINY